MDLVLAETLKPLHPYLERPDLIELSVNQSGEVGLELAQKGYVFEKSKLDKGYWQRLVRVLANLNQSYFDEEKQPFMSGDLPGGHRFQAIISRKNVNPDLSGFMLTIRINRAVRLGLEDFGLTDEREDDLIQTISNYGTVFISGGMSSGKTTFTKALVKHIPLDARIQCVEDAKELEFPHKNIDRYQVDRNDDKQAVNYPKIIDHITRSRPDFIVTGEVSVANAFAVVRLLNLGHGFLTTVHANTPNLSYAAIEQNIAMAGFPRFDVRRILQESIDRIVQLSKVKLDGQYQRQVVEILNPKLNSRWIRDKHHHWRFESLDKES